MHPELFSVFGYEVQAYSFFIYLTAAVVFGGSLWFAQRRGFDSKKTTVVLIVAMVGSFFGARLLHVGLNSKIYAKNPELIFSFSLQGFSMFGGIIMAVVLVAVMCKIWRMDFWKLGDTVAPFLGIGIALMRAGCFLNGCCFGKISDVFWSVRFPAFSQAHVHQLKHGQGDVFYVMPVHPTQIYELMGALIAVAIAIYMIKKKYQTGSALLSFVIFFTVIRWLNYAFFRIMPDTFDASSYFYPTLYGIIMIVSVLLLAKRMKSPNQNLTD